MHKINLKLLYSGKVCVVFTLLFLLYLFVLLPAESRKSDEVTGGLSSPDTTFYYTSNDLKDLISEYSVDARNAYVSSKIRFDILWPLAYGGWLISLIGYSVTELRPKGNAKSRIFTWLPVLPLFAVLFDFLENITVSVAMLTFPDSPFGVIEVAPIFTILKWITLNGAMLIAFGLILLVLLSKMVKKQTI